MAAANRDIGTRFKGGKHFRQARLVMLQVTV